MKKILSIILATAMILSLIPSVFATDGEETTETQKLKIVYEINGLFTTNVTDMTVFTEEFTNGFYRHTSHSGTPKMQGSRGTVGNRTLEVPEDACLTFDVYVPVAGNYTISGTHPHFTGGGTITVSVVKNGTEVEWGKYNSAYITGVHTGVDRKRSYGNDENISTEITTAFPLDKGWNSIKFAASDGLGCVRTFTLTLGDGSDYALMGVHEKNFIVGDEAYTITTVKSSDPATVLTGLTYTSASENVAKVVDGKIVPVGHGKTEITVSDTEGHSYDITVTVDDPNMPTIKYDIDNFVTSEMNRETDMTIITEESSGGFFRYNSHTGGMIRHRGSAVNCCVDVSNGKYVILDIYVPAAGMYTMTGEHPHFKQGGSITVYVNGNEIGSYDSKADEVKHPNAQDANSYNYRESFEFTGIKLNKGWNSFKFEASGGIGTVKTFTLTAGSGDAVMGLSGKELAIGETDTIKAYLSSTAAELMENVTYVSDNPAVVEVSANGTVTAKAKGDANITVTYSGDDVISGMNSFTTKVSVNDAKTAFVSIGVDDDGDGKATIKEAALGEEVTVTATDRENTVFRGWVRGSADNGHLVWDKPEYTFTATTHTYLTAIYSEKVEGEANEYYHWNGQFLGNDKTTAEANISPIVGYTFAKSWTEAKKENSITSWIADFTKNNDEYAVTGNGFTMTKADNKYDTEVTCTSDNAVYWYRDNKLVDYGTEYKFFIWDNTTVKTSNEGHNGAKLMLDKKKNNTYMVEYDAGDAKLLEVGILFGDTGENPTVDSCKEKMSSQRNINEKGHGQFSATAEKYTVARGYLVYQDGDAYRVIYTD